MTRIAVATTDGVSLSQHFGQSKGFVVFEVDGTKIISSEVRTNQDTPHNEGICNHGDHQQHRSNRASGHPWAPEGLHCRAVRRNGRGCGAIAPGKWAETGDRAGNMLCPGSGRSLCAWRCSCRTGWILQLSALIM